MYIAAHPDDENTRALAWFSLSEKAETAYLSLTRGDGGQNLIGEEFSEDLGVLRTQELLAARKIDRAKQFLPALSILVIPNQPTKLWKNGAKPKC